MARYLNESGRITTKDLKSDLKGLNQVLPEEQRVRAKSNDQGKKNKPEFVAAVVTARQRMKEFDSAWEDTRRAEIGSAFVDWTGKGTEALDENYRFEATTARRKWSAVTYMFRGKMQTVRVEDSDEAPATDNNSDGDDDMLQLTQRSNASGITAASSPSTGRIRKMGRTEFWQKIV